MTEEGEIVGVPFKLERRSVEEQIMEAHSRLGKIAARLDAIEERLKLLEGGSPSKPRFEWTTTTPDRPGFYWVVFREGRPEVVALTEDHKIMLVKRTGWVVCMATLAKEAEGAWWYGPIEPPE